MTHRSALAHLELTKPNCLSDTKHVWKDIDPLRPCIMHGVQLWCPNNAEKVQNCTHSRRLMLAAIAMAETRPSSGSRARVQVLQETTVQV